MTQPFDPLNPPNAGIGLRAGMFGDSSRCPNPTCGFASSDQSIYECPSCGAVWRIRPKVADKPTGPAVGTQMAMVCALCDEGFSASKPPVFDGNGLSHATCLAGTGPIPSEDLSASYLDIVKTTQPKKKRRRRRKKRPVPGPVEAVETVSSPPEGDDT